MNWKVGVYRDMWGNGKENANYDIFFGLGLGAYNAAPAFPY